MTEEQSTTLGTTLGSTGEPVDSSAGAVPLTRRLIPRLGSHEVVFRPRLLQQLSAAKDLPLTVVHGPAGAGKSLVVAQWVERQAAGSTAWVTLEADGAGPGLLFAQAIWAMAAAGLTMSDDIGVPASAESLTHGFLGRLAAAIGELQRPVVLVLDNFELVASPAVDGDLSYLAHHAAPYLRLVLISRHGPGPAVARHRALGQLAEIGPADLAFTHAEVEELLRRHGVAVQPSLVVDLTDRTGGWATGLRLAALALRRDVPAASVLQSLSSGDDASAELILAEIVDDLPPPAQHVLLHASILSPVRCRQADELSGRTDSRALLAAVAADTTFVQELADQDAFALHELLAGALHRRLVTLEGPERVAALHRQASASLAAEGRVTEAVSHAVVAGDWQLATELVVTGLAVDLFLTGLETHRLQVLFDALPPDLGSAEAAVVRAGLAMATFDVPACVQQLDEAERRRPTGDAAARLPLDLSAAMLRLIVSRLTGEVHAGLAAGRRAVELIASLPSDQVARHPQLVALVRSSLGTLELWSGSFEAAEGNLTAGLAVANRPGTEQARSNCLGQLAIVSFRRGHLRRSVDYALEGLRLIDRSALSQLTRVPVCHLALAAVAGEWNDLTAMRLHIDQADRSRAVKRDPSLAVMLAVVRGRHELASGRPDVAEQVLGATRAHRERLPESSFAVALLVLEEVNAALALDHLEGAEEILRSRESGSDPTIRYSRAQLLLAEQRPDEALAALGTLATDAALVPSLGIRAGLLHARAAHQLGRSAEAGRTVQTALRRARPETIRRPFLEQSRWLRQVFAARPDLARGHDWLVPELTGQPVAAGSASGLVVDALTPRELQVLTLAAAPMANTEIAAVLAISANTVKTHLSSAYRKLGATSRHEALRRATQAGILAGRDAP